MTTGHSAAGLQWQLRSGLHVAYSTRADGDQREADHRQTWLQQFGVASHRVPRQIHGTTIVVAENVSNHAEADGLVTSDANLALGVYGADCPGLVIDTGSVFGVAHCGWRGVAAGIVTNLVAALVTRTTSAPETWHAFIGPGISGGRYEVDAPVLQARQWPSTAVQPGRDGHAWLDVSTAIAHDLSQAGVVAIQQSEICTADDSRLHSYRHDGEGLVQLLIAWR